MRPTNNNNLDKEPSATLTGSQATKIKKTNSDGTDSLMEVKLAKIFSLLIRLNKISAKTVLFTAVVLSISVVLSSFSLSSSLRFLYDQRNPQKMQPFTLDSILVFFTTLLLFICVFEKTKYDAIKTIGYNVEMGQPEKSKTLLVLSCFLKIQTFVSFGRLVAFSTVYLISCRPSYFGHTLTSLQAFTLLSSTGLSLMLTTVYLIFVETTLPSESIFSCSNRSSLLVLILSPCLKHLANTAAYHRAIGVIGGSLLLLPHLFVLYLHTTTVVYFNDPWETIIVLSHIFIPIVAFYSFSLEMIPDFKYKLWGLIFVVIGAMSLKLILGLNIRWKQKEFNKFAFKDLLNLIKFCTKTVEKGNYVRESRFLIFKLLNSHKISQSISSELLEEDQTLTNNRNSPREYVSNQIKLLIFIAYEKIVQEHKKGKDFWNNLYFLYFMCKLGYPILKPIKMCTILRSLKKKKIMESYLLKLVESDVQVRTIEHQLLSDINIGKDFNFVHCSKELKKSLVSSELLFLPNLALYTFKAFDKLRAKMSSHLKVIEEMFNVASRKTIHQSILHNLASSSLKYKEETAKLYLALEEMTKKACLFHICPYALYIYCSQNNLTMMNKLVRTYRFRIDQLNHNKRKGEKLNKVWRGTKNEAVFESSLELPTLGVITYGSSVFKKKILQNRSQEFLFPTISEKITEKSCSNHLNISDLMSPQMGEHHSKQIEDYLKNPKHPYLGLPKQRVMRVPKSTIFFNVEITSAIRIDLAEGFRCTSLLRFSKVHQHFIILDKERRISGVSELIDALEPRIKGFIAEEPCSFISKELPFLVEEFLPQALQTHQREIKDTLSTPMSILRKQQGETGRVFGSLKNMKATFAQMNVIRQIECTIRRKKFDKVTFDLGFDINFSCSERDIEFRKAVLDCAVSSKNLSEVYIFFEKIAKEKLELFKARSSPRLTYQTQLLKSDSASEECLSSEKSLSIQSTVLDAQLNLHMIKAITHSKIEAFHQAQGTPKSQSSSRSFPKKTTYKAYASQFMSPFLKRHWDQNRGMRNMHRASLRDYFTNPFLSPMNRRSSTPKVSDAINTGVEDQQEEMFQNKLVTLPEIKKTHTRIKRPIILMMLGPFFLFWVCSLSFHRWVHKGVLESQTNLFEVEKNSVSAHIAVFEALSCLDLLTYRFQHFGRLVSWRSLTESLSLNEGLNIVRVLLLKLNQIRKTSVELRYGSLSGDFRRTSEHLFKASYHLFLSNQDIDHLWDSWADSPDWSFPESVRRRRAKLKTALNDQWDIMATQVVQTLPHKMHQETAGIFSIWSEHRRAQDLRNTLVTISLALICQLCVSLILLYTERARRSIKLIYRGFGYLKEEEMELKSMMISEVQNQITQITPKKSTKEDQPSSQRNLSSTPRSAFGSQRPLTPKQKPQKKPHQITRSKSSFQSPCFSSTYFLVVCLIIMLYLSLAALTLTLFSSKNAIDESAQIVSKLKELDSAIFDIKVFQSQFMLFIFSGSGYGIAGKRKGETFQQSMEYFQRKLQKLHVQNTVFRKIEEIVQTNKNVHDDKFKHHLCSDRFKESLPFSKEKCQNLQNGFIGRVTMFTEFNWFGFVFDNMLAEMRKINDSQEIIKLLDEKELITMNFVLSFYVQDQYNDYSQHLIRQIEKFLTRSTKKSFGVFLIYEFLMLGLYFPIAIYLAIIVSKNLKITLSALMVLPNSSLQSNGRIKVILKKVGIKVF